MVQYCDGNCFRIALNCFRLSTVILTLSTLVSASFAEESFIEQNLQTIEDGRKNLSEELISASNSIDEYFSNTSYLKTRNATNIRLTNQSALIEDSGYENNFDFAIRLKLPRSQNKLQLEIDNSVDALETERDTNQAYRRIDRDPNARQNSTKTGLNYYERFMDTDVRLTAGFDFNKKLIPWTNLKLKNDFFLSKSRKHYIQMINDFYGETLRGTEHQAQVSYNFKINSHLLFRQANASFYRDFGNSLEVSHSFIFFDVISDKTSMSYSYSALLNNPSAVSTYYLNRHLIDVAIRRRLFKKHYYISIVPGLIIPKEKSWEVLTALQVKFDVYIGNP